MAGRHRTRRDRRGVLADWLADLPDIEDEAEQLELPVDAGVPEPREAAAPLPRWRRWSLQRVALLTAGLALIGAGLLVIAIPLYGVWQRGRADSQALQTWNNGGAQAIVGAAPANADHLGTLPAQGGCTAAAAPPDDYALVSFPSLPQYGYAQVAGDGTWDMLTQRSMVHYRGTPAPGQQGNVIVAFHREAEFQHIDELKAGDTVDLQDRSCKVWHYTVTQRWTLDPGAVTQLNSTTGHELTLITCTPWYIDTQRIVWRAELAPGQ